MAMDGFWYDKLEEGGNLSWGQIKSITEVTLASLLCENLPGALQVNS
jgi:hypothetical protein